MTNDIDVKSLPLTSLKGAEHDIWMSELSILYEVVYLTKHQTMSVWKINKRENIVWSRMF